MMIYPGGEDREISSNKKTGSLTPVLDNFGRDLTHLAKTGKIDPVIGRDEEVEKTIQILSKRKKNNPILIGKPGVGKTAIVEAIALRIAEKKIERSLRNKRIVELNLNSIISGTKFRGQFEERMDELLKEITGVDDLIIFIDEIHNIIGAGSASGSMDVGNILKPALSRGEFVCIGATTLDEYKKHFENDGALERRFQKVLIDEPSYEETLEILNKIKEKYENHHNVIYSEDVLKSCVELSSRYINFRSFPDKAIDILDEVGAKVKLKGNKPTEKIIKLENEERQINKEKVQAAKLQDFEGAATLRDKQQKLIKQIEIEAKKWEEVSKKNKIEVTLEDVAGIISSHTGIPINKLTTTESEKLINIENELKKSIVGQDEAIQKVSEAIKRSRLGINDPNKPISFMFLGVTGVGKSELAKVMSKYLFNSDKAFIRVDMSEYKEKNDVSKLIGAPPGYVGYEEKGQLTEKIKTNPYSIILFDEIEKAHPDVFDVLLQILDEGRLTDSYGKEFNFKNAIIIMTSNIGTSEIVKDNNRIGFSTNLEHNDVEQLVQKELEKKFKPEFINRVDEFIVFKALEKEDMIKIVDIHINKLIERVNKSGYNLSITKPVKEFIAEVGFDKKRGARPIKRAIVKYIENEISKSILDGKFKENNKIIVKIKEGKIHVDN